MDLGAIADRLHEHEPGLWVTSEPPRQGYPEAGHRRCLAVEDSSYWFRHRNECITTVFARFPPAGTVFDIGGGNGAVVRVLRRVGHDAVVVEPGADGARAALGRGLSPVVNANVEAAGFQPGSLPAASMFDVLEHIDDDRDFLRGLGTLLAPGGRLYLAVPAYTWLWSEADRLAHHVRRYTQRSLRRAVTDAGFEVEYTTSFFRLLPGPILVFRTIPSLLGRRRKPDAATSSEHSIPAGIVGKLLDRSLGREVAVLRHGRMRFGSSILLVARSNG